MSFHQLKAWRSTQLDDVKWWLAQTHDVDQVAHAAKLLLDLRPVRNQHGTPPGLMDLDEAIRRTERRLGELVRAGQAVGSISRNNTRHGRPPKDITDRHRLHWGYVLFDRVSVEQFEAAMVEGRRQGSLTRNSVENLLHPEHVAARAESGRYKVRTWVPLSDRLDQIRRLAATGHQSNQIAQMLGVTGDHVRRLAKENDIRLPESRVGRRAPNADRVVGESISTLEGVAMAIGLIDTDDLDPDRVAGWAASLKDSIRTLQHLHKEMTR